MVPFIENSRSDTFKVMENRRVVAGGRVKEGGDELGVTQEDSLW